ncbi:PQQ-dependent sugar dehydrogenase [Halolamina salifodinae]|uniref:Glucose/arabinose dehydrogenase n=1 Tax=Halolamina salifodinae TaxID=1202767 RepID=A0A8T4GSR7_9EURY|nr:PQQ-dependent sugar dehydrogenase [Halolamina salifodinae]MBP1985919.1 glucose/arabinose dehydrogenase [Halolamina salifodinae]
MDPDSLSRRTILALSTVGLAGCSTGVPSDTEPNPSPGGTAGLDHDETAWDGYDPDWSAPTDAAEPELEIEVLAENLEIPWDLSFAPNGDLYLTERPGQVLRYADGEVTPLFEPAGAIDGGSVPPGSDEKSWFVDGGEGGTMGVEVHPNYPEVSRVFVCYTANDTEEPVVRLAAFDPESDDPGEPVDVLLEAPAKADTNAFIHNGGRIRFGPANYLWMTMGDAGNGEFAADPESLAGKTLRVTPSGDPAPGNSEKGDPRVFSIGHRNPQGLSWLPDATPVVNEHGPGPDEVNALAAGTEYGWPDARQPDEYAGTDYRRPIASSKVESTVWAPSGSSFYRGEAAPTLQNRLLVGCLAEQRLKSFTLTPSGEEPPALGETGQRHSADWLDDTYTVTSHDLLVDELGRIRHVEPGPDGALYAITSNRDGRANAPFPLERDDVLVRIAEA